MLRVVEEHLGSTQVARVIYGAIIGVAVVVALEHHPPTAEVMVGTVLGTAIAVGLAELYAEIIGEEVRTRGRVARQHFGEIAVDVGAVVLGVGFPAVFFLLSVVGVMKVETAFTFAKWSGLGLIGFYGFVAARLAGTKMTTALLHAGAVALVGAFLIGLKALIH
jgi:hypothetical protein